MQDGCIRARVTQVSSGWEIDLAPRLPGRFQLQNALNAIAAARLLRERGFRISDDDISEGIASTVWPGRIEKLQSHPDVYLDGAHNPSAARELATFLEENFAGRKIYLLYGALATRPLTRSRVSLFPFAEVIFTEPPARFLRRSLPKSRRTTRRKFVIADAEQALTMPFESRARRRRFITGSLYLVGQSRH
jgi:dihydrofolate synthase/folylpolyglutamate synthase